MNAAPSPILFSSEQAAISQNGGEFEIWRESAASLTCCRIKLEALRSCDRFGLYDDVGARAVDDGL